MPLLCSVGYIQCAFEIGVAAIKQKMSNSTNLFAQDGNPVKVVARLRPLNQLEREKGSHITAVPLGETEIDIQVRAAAVAGREATLQTLLNSTSNTGRGCKP